MSHRSSQTVPNMPATHTSTCPSYGLLPPVRRRSPNWQVAFPKIKYISKDDIRPDSAKTEKVKNYPGLIDVTGLRQFLGHI